MEEYETQLIAVEQALSATKNGTEEHNALKALKTDLLELLELTRQTEAATAPEEDPISCDNLDDEMQRFMSEIGQLEKKPTSTAKDEVESEDEDVELRLNELKAKLEPMIGQKCSAPHQHSWGAVSYHNAIICSVEETVDDGNSQLDVRLRILFTNPTHREMLPCNYYLDGECRFDDARCHFSHGELVAAAELRDYVAPEFERLSRNCVVLARLQDRMWHRGRVLCVNFVEKSCRVRLDGKEHKERERDFAFEELLPIFHDDDLSSGSSSDSNNDETDSEELDDMEEARKARLVEQSLFTYQPTQPLGEWEQHTRGIGSKLMAKMGYIHGTGLGSDGRGIITPISAQILPQGRSLDHCMELREAANGDKDLFSVEKKMRRQQKKQQLAIKKSYTRDSQQVDVFSFLNGSVLGRNQEAATSRNKNEKSVLQLQTTKSLNVESVRIADEIRKKEREISKMHESISRNACDTEVHKRLQIQLGAKTQELNALQREEKCLSKEQATRRTKDKLSVF